MQHQELLKLLGNFTRIRHDFKGRRADRLALELEINGEYMVMLDMATLLDTLWFVQKEKLIPPCRMTGGLMPVASRNANS